MKILVTGGAGFIGSHVVDAYITAGHDVVVVDNLSTGRKSNLNKKAVFYDCDITDEKKLLEIFHKEKPEIVNHHAAQMNVRKSVENPLFDAQVNVLGLLNVLSCSTAVGVSRFIFISSGGAIYGEPSLIPTPENVEIKPLSPYGLAKYVGEQYVQLYHRLYGLPFVILRYANVYGPRQNAEGEAGVISIFIDAMKKNQKPVIFGSGKQTRDYIHVADIVSANILALERGENQIFNIGTGKETSVLEIFTNLKNKFSFSDSCVFAPEKKGEVSRSCLDSTLAKKILQWEAQISLPQGLALTLEVPQ